jgi:NAD(P)H-hydrate epimerase
MLIMSSYPEILYPVDKALTLKDFREMDYYAVNQYFLPIELMMENAGLHLARFVSKIISQTKIIKIGVGNGNNGGGGLVAARRLAAWGYEVYIDTFTEIDKPIPAIQLKRAMAFGASVKEILNPDVWIDAYLGFSQRLPLDETLISRINQANSGNALKISLDIPTGYLGDINSLYFESDSVISLAAPKRILYDLPEKTELYIADLGIPNKVYKIFNVTTLPFYKGGILKLKR